MLANSDQEMERTTTDIVTDKTEEGVVVTREIADEAVVTGNLPPNAMIAVNGS